MVNSCLGHLSAAWIAPRLPLLRTYGVNLPSSLTTLLPLVLGFSPHPPVSVYGTGTPLLDSGFSRQCGFSCFGTCFSLPITASNRRAYFTTRLSIPLGRAFPAARSAYPPVSPPLSVAEWSYRNINLLSIDYAFRPRLRSRLTLGGRTFPRKPWIFDGEDSHSTLVTYSDILTTDRSTRPSGRASPRYSKLPYQLNPLSSAASVHGLAPLIFGAGPLD